MTIGESILKNRKKLGMSQEKLAERLFVSRQTISQWEKDQTQPTIDNLKLLKEVFGISIDEICAECEKDETINSNSLDTICAALTYAMGIDPPKYAAEKNFELSNYIDKVFDGQKADRVVMYNPDAIAQWVYQKYPEFLASAIKDSDKEIYISTVMPSVTPVCFGTMYTGALPEVHGIKKYEKPIITIDTIFDRLVEAGKKVALIASPNCSLGRIYLGRNIDYFLIEQGGAAVNAKAMEIILRDEHDFIVVYNGNFDTAMHKKGPESANALAELRVNSHVFSMMSSLIKTHWKHHNTLVGFAMDHGCHEIDGNCGSHGVDMPEDINIVHLYKGYPKKVN